MIPRDQVYWTHDIANAIKSNVLAILAAAHAHGAGNVEYCRGVLDLARALAVAFDLGDWREEE